MTDTNQAVQSHVMVSGLKLRILQVKGLHYLCSKNKGADQLWGYRTADLDQLWVYRTADLRICFRICKMPVFSRLGSNEK